MKNNSTNNRPQAQTTWTAATGRDVARHVSTSTIQCLLKMVRVGLLICTATMTVQAQTEIPGTNLTWSMPYLYLEDKNGETTEIQFTDGTMAIIENRILIGTPNKNYEYDYDDIERFYFKDYQQAALSGLTVSEGTLSPVFNSNILNYTVNVPNNTSSLTITATANDENATVDGDGIKILAAGENSFTITVTAEDGITTLKYMITVNLAATTDITIADSDFEVKIYPNPTDGKVTVHIPDGLNEFKLISIYTVAGQQIEDKTITDEYTYFDLKDEPEGVYLVKIFKKSGQSIIKILVKQ